MSSTSRSTKVAHIGFGPVGQRIVADFLSRRLGALCKVIDIDPSFAGKPLGKFVANAPDELVISQEIGLLPSVDVAVIATTSSLERLWPTLQSLLSQGVSVVSTCEELAYPWMRHPDLARDIDALAKKNGAAVLGTGVNPGFLMDIFPIAMTSVCSDVQAIRIHRVQDASTRRKPFQAKIGAGMTSEEFDKKVRDGELGHVGLGESMHLVADTLGLTLDGWHEYTTPVIAPHSMRCEMGVIERGEVSGVLQFARGYRGDDCVVEYVFQAAIGQIDPHDRVAIEGTPPLDVVIKGGVHGDTATSAITLNAIKSVKAARPGLHTMATLPIPGWSPPLTTS
jgi:2,4-diaminopentanoate dehydrogenase